MVATCLRPGGEAPQSGAARVLERRLARDLQRRRARQGPAPSSCASRARLDWIEQLATAPQEPPLHLRPAGARRGADWSARRSRSGTSGCAISSRALDERDTGIAGRRRVAGGSVRDRLRHRSHAGELRAVADRPGDRERDHAAHGHDAGPRLRENRDPRPHGERVPGAAFGSRPVFPFPMRIS